jgi:hypothetical protein
MNLRLVSLLLAIVACAEPQVLERSAAACSNGIDDDVDGSGDCDDPDCLNSGACEKTLESCRNGLDDDRNGRTDCEQDSCRSAGLCVAFEAACEVVPQAGCPVGMGCYVASIEKRACALAGNGEFGSTCSTELGAPDGCAAGLQCLGGECSAFCSSDDDCPRATACLVRDDFKPIDFALCTVPCDPVGGLDDCPADDECVSMHMMGGASDLYGTMWWCSTIPTPADAQLGEPCDDPPNYDGVSGNGICANNLACVADATGETRCRALCKTFLDGTTVVGCPANQDCVTFYAVDPRPAVHWNAFSLGACLDR